MRKQELIHTHELLAEIVQYYERTEDSEIPREAYDTIGVRPTSLPASKEKHKEAVMTLLDEITHAIDDETDATTRRLARTAD